MAKFNLSALEPDWRFQLPSGQWMTVVEVRPFEEMSKKNKKKSYNAGAGYVEVETKEPYLPRTNVWFTAPAQHRVDVEMCARCTNFPAIILDVYTPKNTFGQPNRICQYCAVDGF